jgi:hypothetical protein
MPTISPHKPKAMTTGEIATYHADFHDGHRAGRADALVGKFDQFRAALDPKRPAFGEGYRAGHRLGAIERKRQ